MDPSLDHPGPHVPRAPALRAARPASPLRFRGLRGRWPAGRTVNPRLGEARNNLGQMLERQRRLDDAAAEYRQAVESRPGLRIARFNLGRMLIALGRPGEAIAALEPLLAARDAETPRHLFALSAAMVRANRRTEGLKLAEEARALAIELGQTELAAAIGRELASLTPHQ